MEILNLYKKNIIKTKSPIKPFLKWAGGKTGLLKELLLRIPSEMYKNSIDTYIEPFVGGGALFFYLATKFKLKNKIIIDKNEKLISLYLKIKNEPYKLLEELENINSKYNSLNEKDKIKFYYEKRNEFNNLPDSSTKKSALLIFLNKTCYNGLYRENSKGEFNVPAGRYKNPKIYDKENILMISKILKDTIITAGDFELLKNYIRGKTFIYFDPPYRPVSKTSNFTAYNSEGFNDNEQIRLRNLFIELHNMGLYLMLSNSDSKLTDENHNFFEKLYDGFVIEKITAKRYINSNSKKRGSITEIIIRNYGYKLTDERNNT